MNQIKNLKIIGDKQSSYIKYSYGDNTFELITDITILEDGTESERISIFVTKLSGEKLQLESHKTKEILNSVNAILNEEDVDTNLNSITMLILNDMVNMKPIEIAEVEKEDEGEKKYTFREYKRLDFKIRLIFALIGVVLGIIMISSEMSQESEPDIFDYDGSYY